ncbi:MAG: ATP-binding protein [Elusimicrobiota bacterium]
MKIKVFISSVQKELEDERLALQILLTTDPFLSEHCVPILYEEYPVPLKPDPEAYLQLLDTCQVYLGIIWQKYGDIDKEGLSATYKEYTRAQKNKMPTLIVIKGKNTLERDTRTEKFIKEIKKADHKYERFENTEELQEKVRKRLIKHIKDTYHIEPTASQEEIAKKTIQVASAFERQRLNKLSWDEMDKGLAGKLVSEAEKTEIVKLEEKDIVHSLWQRGYLWKDEDEYFGTAAGILLFGKDPTAVFTHTRVQVAAYPNTKKTHKPIDHDTVRKPLAIAIDEVVAFINKNTRHPLRVVGLNRVQVDEYPEEAVREALVNALAHRDYEDAGRRIEVNLFKDRIEVTSPGELPGDLTLRKLLSGQAKSRSRNPNIAQGLNLLDRMEERGTGIQRMTEDMLNHGLDKPQIKIIDNEVKVILYGPGEDLDRIKTPRNIPGFIPPAMEEKLNERQKKILKHVLETGEVTSGWCKKEFGVVYDTAHRDLAELVKLDILEKRGKGRGTKYVLKTYKD